MKKLLTLILIVISYSVGMGQKDSIVLDSGISEGIFSPSLFHNIHFYKGRTRDTFGIKDTVKVLMMVCDTGTKEDFDSMWIIFNPRKKSEEIGPFYKIVPYVYWIYGYEVIEYVAGGWDAWDNQYDHHWEFRLYLDENKKPLNKNIVVWETKDIGVRPKITLLGMAF